jgi:hypothetical protein
LIIDNSEVWIIGGSIKDAGKKPAYLIPLSPSIALKKIEIYEKLWEESSN